MVGQMHAKLLFGRRPFRNRHCIEARTEVVPATTGLRHMQTGDLIRELHITRGPQLPLDLLRQLWDHVHHQRRFFSHGSTKSRFPPLPHRRSGCGVVSEIEKPCFQGLCELQGQDLNLGPPCYEPLLVGPRCSNLFLVCAFPLVRRSRLKRASGSTRVNPAPQLANPSARRIS